MGEFTNNSGYAVANIDYNWSAKHFISFNHTYSDFTRKDKDASTANSSETTGMRRVNRKNVSGLAYRYQANNRLNANLFGKYYHVYVVGPVDTTGGSDNAVYEEQSRYFSSTGYGAAVSYDLVPSTLQAKVSYEKSYRLPTSNELFGDEVLEEGDASLGPEQSNNINFNLIVDKDLNEKHNVHAEAAFIYRNTQDYIRRVISEAKNNGIASYINHGEVRTLGIDFEFGYSYMHRFVVNGSFTYQEIRNMERYTPEGREAIYYKDRMPNEPYLFGNINASYYWNDLFENEDMLILGYNGSYVHDFYRSWESEGGKIIIPGNTTHDFSLNYSMRSGKYNIGLEALNVFDALVYDNYSLQKPGRSFTVKLRYFFNK